MVAANVDPVCQMAGRSLHVVGANMIHPYPLVPIVTITSRQAVTFCDGLEGVVGTHAPCAVGDQGSEIATAYLAAHSVNPILDKGLFKRARDFLRF